MCRKRRNLCLYISTHLALNAPRYLGKAAGGDVFVLAKIVGHSSTTITQHYVHPQADAMGRVFSRVGTKLGTTGKARRTRTPSVQKHKGSQTSLNTGVWCREGESTPHRPLGPCDLSSLRLSISPSRHFAFHSSVTTGSLGSSAASGARR